MNAAVCISILAAVDARVSPVRGATLTALQTGIDAENKSAYGIWINPNNGPKSLSVVKVLFGLGRAARALRQQQHELADRRSSREARRIGRRQEEM